MKTQQSVIRRKATEAFMEVQIERDRLYHTLGAVRSLISNEVAVALIDEEIENMEKHKAEVRKLLDGTPFDEAA